MTNKNTAFQPSDTALLSLVHKGYDIELQIADLQAKLDQQDKDTDAAFRARNEAAARDGREVFVDLDAFVESMS